jgi:hypothetical protein
MHWNVVEIFWALILAGHLVLLVVLLGRDRTSRFPWFTAAIGLSTVRLLADHLLHGKLTTIAFYWQTYTTMALSAILGILVLVELTRQVFSSGKGGLRLKANGWLGWGFITVAVSVAAVWAWGRPWPTWQTLNSQPAQLPLLLTIPTGMKGELFVGLLTVQVGLLLIMFGRRFGFGWRSQPQQIALGLSTNALGFLAVQAISESINRSVHVTTRAELNRVVHLLTNLDNARNAIWLLVLIWWIVWMWRDEPGSATTSLEAADAPILAGPPTLEADIEEDDLDFRD